jgi:hypothetical protein
MQDHGLLQLSPIPTPHRGAMADACLSGEQGSGAQASDSTRDERTARESAGVAQLVEHLFCKQVVRGSSPLASSQRAASETRTKAFKEGCPSGQREQAVNLPAHAYGGSNPPPSTRFTVAGVAQLVERQPSKLNVEGSNPFSRSPLLGRRHPPARAVCGARHESTQPKSTGPQRGNPAHLAQLVEHVLGKDEVTSSILVVGSNQTFLTLNV